MFTFHNDKRHKTNEYKSVTENKLRNGSNISIPNDKRILISLLFIKIKKMKTKQDLHL